MYKQHFDLTGNPFRANAEGTAIFVGPQQARIVTSLKKDLTARDSVIVVSGTAGVGKTTIVTRALETNKALQMVAWIGRVKLPPDDVLQLLLPGFGIRRQFAGTIQRFAAFKQLLSRWAAADTRVVIVVEDAMRIGNDALLELESLTAADTGDGSGANIVLMGPPEMKKLIAAPSLARLRQRSRLVQTIAPFNAAEVQGYLKHCIRTAGGNYDAIFNANAADMLYRCSEGLPRVINNLCESALQAAAEDKAEKVSAELVQKVAAEVHGLEPVLPASDPVAEQIAPKPPAAAAEPEPEPEPEEVPAAPTPELEPEPEPEEAPAALTPEPEPEEKVEPIEAQFEMPQAKKRIPPLEMTGADFKLPAIDKQDAMDQSDYETEEPPSADIPTLSDSMRVNHPIVENLAAPEEPPVTEPEAPVAEIEAEPATPTAEAASPIPDLDALNAAISAAHKRESEPNIDPLEDQKPPLLEPEIHEITLENSLVGQRKNNAADLRHVAKELSKAESLEDISDIGAETLFGEELEAAAAEALGKPVAEGTPGQFIEEPSPVMLDMEPDKEAKKGPPGKFDMSMSQRYAVVNSLHDSDQTAANDSPPIEITLGKDEKGVPPKPRGELGPSSIEDQIDTEITQTQKALEFVSTSKAMPPKSISPKATPHKAMPPKAMPPKTMQTKGNGAEDKKTSKLLGLFRRSSGN